MTMTFIKSGEWTVKANSGIIRTDLGSCVSICLWDGCLKRGGMNHFLMPGDAPAAAGALLSRMLKDGSAPWGLQGAIVGGGRMHMEKDRFTIGKDNVSAAETLLRDYGIPLVFQRVGGAVSRSVEMDISGGGLAVLEIGMGTGLVTRHYHKFSQCRVK